MVRINTHYQKLQAGYLFPEISRRVQNFAAENATADLIRLGIGDVTRPLPDTVVEGLLEGSREMGEAASFRGYGPEQGYQFLRELIVEHEYGVRGVEISADEVFVSDGSKCDSGNIQEIFSLDSRVAVTDPVYPVYVDTNVMAGRTGPADGEGRYDGILYMPCLEERQFLPEIPSSRVDLIYLCFPNNPTGAVATKAVLQEWVDYARRNESVILFDAAYEAFIRDPEIPHSIYEIEGAREVAIEFRSFSKNAGFTGTRCAFTVVPKEVMGVGDGDSRVPIHTLWNRRHSTKFNGVSYPVQLAASRIYSTRGQQQVRELTDYYMENARIIREGLKNLDFQVFAGTNAPYIWLKTPQRMSSWEFFDHLLEKAHVVGTPGAGFGPAGEGYFRLSAFGERAQVSEAVERIRTRL